MFEVTTKKETPGSAWDRDELGSVDAVRMGTWTVIVGGWVVYEVGT